MKFRPGPTVYNGRQSRQMCVSPPTSRIGTGVENERSTRAIPRRGTKRLFPRNIRPNLEASPADPREESPLRTHAPAAVQSGAESGSNWGTDDHGRLALNGTRGRPSAGPGQWTRGRRGRRGPQRRPSSGAHPGRPPTPASRNLTPAEPYHAPRQVDPLRPSY